MTKEQKQKVLIDLYSRALCGVKVSIPEWDNHIHYLTEVDLNKLMVSTLNPPKPYLRSLKTMTKMEATEIAILCGAKNILSTRVEEEYIDVEVDDGVCSTERITFWYADMPNSLKVLDYLNKHHFDYRGLIPDGLALEAPEGIYKIDENGKVE